MAIYSSFASKSSHKSNWFELQGSGCWDLQLSSHTRHGTEWHTETIFREFRRLHEAANPSHTHSAWSSARNVVTECCLGLKCSINFPNLPTFHWFPVSLVWFLLRINYWTKNIATQLHFQLVLAKYWKSVCMDQQSAITRKKMVASKNPTKSKLSWIHPSWSILIIHCIYTHYMYIDLFVCIYIYTYAYPYAYTYRYIHKIHISCIMVSSRSFPASFSFISLTKRRQLSEGRRWVACSCSIKRLKRLDGGEIHHAERKRNETQWNAIDIQKGNEMKKD